MTQQQVLLNSEKLRSISHSSHTAEVTMTALAVRERLRHFSDITRTRNNLIRKGEKIVDSDYVAFWKGLEDAGIGKIVYGRKGKADRFEWHYSMKKVASAALEGKDVLAERVSGASPARQPVKAIKPVLKKVVQFSRSAKKDTSNKSLETPKVNTQQYFYIPVRRDFNLSVPTNLSKEEIEYISSALRRLSA